MGREYRKEQRATLNRHRHHLNTLVIITAVFFTLGFLVGRSEIILLVIHNTVNQLTDVMVENKHPNTNENDYHNVHYEPINILGELLKQKKYVEEELRSDYGQYFSALFDKVSISKLFPTSKFSGELLRRKMIMKIVESKLNYESNNPDISEFTWVTAGDSAAAGHGNLFSQSYTNVLEDTVRDSFQAAGMKFVGKNYGMGWMGSAPESALCMESLYGLDIEVLSWDFQLTDQDHTDRTYLWASRAGVHSSHPFQLFHDRKSSKRMKHFYAGFNSVGLGYTLMDHDFLYEVMAKRLPDAVIDKSINMKSVPESVRYFNCNGNVEGSFQCDDALRNNICEDYDNGKVCMDFKYDHLDDCHSTRYQKSWTPGWKVHQLKGRLLGYFLIDQLSDALIELDRLRTQSDSSKSTWKAINDHLKSQEEEEYETFYDSKDYIDKELFKNDKSSLIGFDPKLLYRERTICHTALLPSEIRYNGILTESTNRGNYENSKYDTGLPEKYANPGGLLPLVHEPSSRCKFMDIDHKDYFLVRYTDEWLEATVPNSAEIATYGRRKYKPEGYIMICLKSCPLNRCPDDVIGFQSIGKARSPLSIRVSGKPVSGAKKFDSCYLLEGLNGYRWELGQHNFQHKIQFKIDENSRKKLRISSFIFF